MFFNLHITIALSLIIGVLSGVYAPQYLSQYVFIGKAFITLLKYIVVPLVFGSLITGIVSLGSVNSLRKMGLKTLIYFVGTTILSSTIGIILAIIFKPGRGISSGDLFVLDVLPGNMTLRDMISTILPNNFFDVISGGHMLFIIILSICIGVIILVFGRHITFPLNELFEGFNEFMIIITQWVILISPIGIYGLIARLVVETGVGAFFPLLKFITVVLLGLIIYASGVLASFVVIFNRISPIGVLKDVFPSITTGFLTASSAATLPVLMDDVRKKLKVPNKVASFVLPLGITINMDGTALFQSVAVMFISQMYGIDLTLSMMITVIVMVLLASISAAAVPSAGIITLSMILTMTGIPVDGVAMILAIDRFLDMFRTSVNLWGNAVASIIVTKWSASDAYE